MFQAVTILQVFESVNTPYLHKSKRVMRVFGVDGAALVLNAKNALPLSLFGSLPFGLEQQFLTIKGNRK